MDDLSTPRSASESRILYIAPTIGTRQLQSFLAQAHARGVMFEPRSWAELPRAAAEPVAMVLRAEDTIWVCWADAEQLVSIADRAELVFDSASVTSLLRQCIDFFAWPCAPDELAVRLGRILGTAHEHGEDAEEPIAEQLARDLGLIGTSVPFKAACRRVTRLSRYDVPVLVEGETGTGKELFSRALHYLGARRSKPFVPVNCGALPDNLFENELFGHVSGAYTDARSEARGLVAQAEGGTLLLDEVHCLSPKGQVALLRFVQDHSYRPLGATSTRRADVRLLAATNQSLAKCVAEGTFREDLHHRLNVGQLQLPPLRARREDVPLLVENILARLSARHRTGPRRCSVTSLSWLKAQDWPGNVRELENVVNRAFLMTDADVIQVEATAARLSAAENAAFPAGDFRAARNAVLTDFEARYVRAQLAETGGNVTAAALRAGKDRRVFGRLMRKHGIDRREFDALSSVRG